MDWPPQFWVGCYGALSSSLNRVLSLAVMSLLWPGLLLEVSVLGPEQDLHSKRWSPGECYGTKMIGELVNSFQKIACQMHSVNERVFGIHDFIGKALSADVDTP